MQQIGRAGRSGSEAKAILYHARGDLSKSYFSQDIKDYAKNNDTCRREIIANLFGAGTHQSAHKSCCDICEDC